MYLCAVEACWVVGKEETLEVEVEVEVASSDLSENRLVKFINHLLRD